MAKRLPARPFLLLMLVLGTAQGETRAEGVGPISVDAKTISVGGNGYHRSFPCNGRKLIVEGSDHVITTSGVCSDVEITGAKNQVDVAIAPQGTLDVAGTLHVVRWKSSGEPKQEISGIDNKVTRVR
ncbi:DUF3060 domain-containing protein [Pseudoduganella flava]|nr:DUF3060 domain-containing protein [Pseudoduganella flava]